MKYYYDIAYSNKYQSFSLELGVNFELDIDALAQVFSKIRPDFLSWFEVKRSGGVKVTYGAYMSNGNVCSADNPILNYADDMEIQFRNETHTEDVSVLACWSNGFNTDDLAVVYQHLNKTGICDFMYVPRWSRYFTLNEAGHVVTEKDTVLHGMPTTLFIDVDNLDVSHLCFDWDYSTKKIITTDLCHKDDAISAANSYNADMWRLIKEDGGTTLEIREVNNPELKVCVLGTVIEGNAVFPKGMTLYTEENQLVQPFSIEGCRVKWEIFIGQKFYQTTI